MTPKLMLCCLHQQNVFLSQSHISLGNIPVQSKCSRLFFLNNISKNETIVFTWKPRSLDFGEVRVHICSQNQNLGLGSSLILYSPISPHHILSHPAQPILVHLVLPYLTSYCPLQSNPILPCTIPSHPIPSHLGPPCCILPPKSTGSFPKSPGNCESHGRRSGS
jgi:hypothetical protein